MINNNIIGMEYLRYSEIETWENIVKCKETKYLRKEYIKDLMKEIVKEVPKDISINEIFEMIEDILRYLENDESGEYETNQGIIGLQYLFRAYIVKVLIGLDFSSTRFKKLNKILIKYCIIYHVKC